MLHLILQFLPAPLHRGLLRLAHRLRSAYMQVRRPVYDGVCIIARDSEGRVLLVRHSYDSGRWTLPGGGVKRAEDPERAARREFAEELGPPPISLTLLGMRVSSFHGAKNSVYVFTGEAAGPPRPDMREVIAARFFALDRLPPDLGPLSRGRLRLLERSGPAQNGQAG